ncbi:MAG: peptidoglycan-binding protein, partial [Alphaproteobacteria bacterium]
ESDIVRGLKDDLQSLKLAVGDTGHTAQNSLDSVDQTIAQIIDRLARLEDENRDPDETPGAAPIVARAPAPATSQPIEGPAADSHQAADGEAAAFVPVFNELAPGESGSAPAPAADPAAQPVAPIERDARARRANFIAAARRAAQAAAAESAAVSRSNETSRPVDGDEQDTTKKPGPFKRITSALNGRRKVLVLAAAAILIAVGAMQIYGDVSSDGDTRLIAMTDQVKNTAPFREVSDTAVISPTAGASGPALVPPVASGEPYITFAEPIAEGTTFARLPPVSIAPTNFAKATPPVQMLDQTALTGSTIGSAELVAAAVAGNAEAAFEIGQRYASGTRVERDMVQARTWFEKAAQSGLAPAQYRLGSLNERGVGGGKNLVAAADWYQRAADAGNINAMHNLAVLMSEGVEGAPDHLRAIQWFRAAADYGVKDSQYNLGVLYARGIGQDQNLVESYKWFAIAASSGDSDAAQRRDEIADLLQPTDLGRARAIVKGWTKRQPVQEANAVNGTWADTKLIGADDQQALVQEIQLLLADRGFDPGPRDGLIGPRTRDAVIAFQRQKGLTADGRIDQTLLAALASTTS